MKKTLLLCFIHGFKGDDFTFGTFPEFLKGIVNNALPNINVRQLVYPKFETRGDLEECVREFKEWLLEKVIDIEVENGSDSPTVDPSVRVILIGHSMGGIIAVETVLSIVSEKHINSSNLLIDLEPTDINTITFPYIQGVLAFDTPFLGLSPGVFSHLSPPISTLSHISDISSILLGQKKSESQKDVKVNDQFNSHTMNASKSISNQSWTKIAAIAGTGLMLAAGSATAAYLNRDSITQSWSWVGSHLKFVSCLMKREELQKRTQAMLNLHSELNIGFGNIYTVVGRKGAKKSVSTSRTFCIVPQNENAVFWHHAVNDDAVDETSAHLSMFFPANNPGYYAMSQKAKSLILQWCTAEWYSMNTNNINLPMTR